MDESNRRKSGRLLCVGLVSDLGDVPDLSAGGCRVACTRLRRFSLGERRTFALRGEDSQILVEGVIVRRRRTGMFTYEYGIEFTDLSLEQRNAVNDLFRTTSIKRLMPTVDEAANRAA